MKGRTELTLTKHIVAVGVGLIMYIIGIVGITVTANAAELTDPSPEEIVRLINNERTSRGREALEVDASFGASAVIRAEEASVMFSHTRPDGSAYYSLDDNIWAENLAYGYPTSEAIVTAWMNSTVHRKNVLYDAATTIGVGVYQSGDGTWYAAMLTD